MVGVYMKNGFTLIELLAVIFILGVLSAIVVPNLFNTYKDKQLELYDNTVSEIERYASIYVVNNPSVFKEIEINGSINISISELCDSKIATCPITDPRDESIMDGYVKVSVDSNNIENYIYEYFENN